MMSMAVRIYMICLARVSSAVSLLLAVQQANSVIQIGLLNLLHNASMYLIRGRVQAEVKLFASHMQFLCHLICACADSALLKMKAYVCAYLYM